MILRHSKLVLKRFGFLAAIALFYCLPSYAGVLRYELGIDGLACPFCAYGIEKELHKLKGVERIETDIAGGMIRLLVEEGSAPAESDIREAVRKAGFTLRSFEQKGVGDP